MTWLRLAAVVTVALGTACASSKAPAGHVTYPDTRTWQQARKRLEQLRAEWAPKNVSMPVSVQFRDQRTGRSLQSRGVIATLPGQAVRMILLGPGGTTAMDLWSRDEHWRLAIPARDQVTRGTMPVTAPPRGSPVGFFRWWFMHPLEGKLLDARHSERDGWHFTLREGQSVVQVQSSADGSLRVTRRVQGQTETVWAQGPGCSDAIYEQEQLGLQVRVHCEAAGKTLAQPRMRAFEDPDAAGR